MNHFPVSPTNRASARSMRRAMTDAELKLWNELRAHRLMGLGFRRQMPIAGYIADFACPSHKLIIEVDGSQHGDAVTYDAERTRQLEARGWTVVRFWNDDVLRDIDGVCSPYRRRGRSRPHRRANLGGHPLMIDHTGIAVSDYAKSKAFYDAAFAAIGAQLVHTVAPEFTGGKGVVGYGRDKGDFWLTEGGEPGPGRHIAFTARTRAEVDAFHAAALAAGGRDNGAPGLRPQYSPNYYGAFVFDPDGNNVEAVCRAPE